MKYSLLTLLFISAGIPVANAADLKYYMAKPVITLKPTGAAVLIPSAQDKASLAWNVASDTLSTDFGVNASKSYTLTNTGTVPISGLSFTWGEGSATPVDCTSVLQPGQSCVVAVSVNNLVAGSRNSALSVSGTSLKGATSAALTVAVSVAAAQAALTLDSENATLTGYLGATATRTFNLTNSNNTPVSLSSMVFSEGDISHTTCGSSMPANSSCSVTIETTFDSESAKSGSLTIRYGVSSENVLSIPVVVQGQYQWKNLTTDKASVTLQGNVGTTGSNTVVLTNPNTRPVALGTITFPAGTLDSGCGSSLGAGASCTLTLSSTLANESTTAGNLLVNYTKDVAAVIDMPVAITGVDPYANFVGLRFSADALSINYTDSTGNVFTKIGAGALSLTAGPNGDPNSLYFDGSVGLTTPQNSKWWLGPKFTVEAWIKPTEIRNGQIIGVHLTGNTCNWMLYITKDGALTFHWGPSVRHSTADGLIKTNVWQKVAASKGDDGVLKLLINDTVVAAHNLGVNAAPPVVNSTLGVTLGNDSGTNFGFKGGIEDLRITNGAGRY